MLLLLHLLGQAFFFTPAKKLKAKKTQAPRKLKHFLAKKLKVPEDILRIGPQKLQFKLILLPNVLQNWLKT